MRKPSPLLAHCLCRGNSVGAAFALFELGIGVNLGLIVWLMIQFGWRRVLA
jgi:uncharacterized protein